MTRISKTLEAILARTAFDTAKSGATHSLRDFLFLEILREEGSLAYQILASRLQDWEIQQVRLRVEQEIAAHFLTFLSNADNNTHLSRECGSLPIHLGAAAMEDSLTEGDLAAELTMAASGDRYRYAFEPTMYKAYTGYREEAEEKVSQFARGELSKADLLSYLDDYWNTACAEEGKLWK